MIYFDKKTLALVRYIKRNGNKGVTWNKLAKKFSDDLANPILLISLSKELYIITKNQNGEWISFDNYKDVICGDFRSFSTPKANEMIERKCFDFWKWIIPTVISVAALIISVLSAIT